MSDLNDYKQWNEYQAWKRQQASESDTEADRYAVIDQFIDDFFLKNWDGVELTKLWNNKTNRMEWVWSERPPKVVAVPQHVKANTKRVPDTLREMVEGRHDS